VRPRKKHVRVIASPGDGSDRLRTNMGLMALALALASALAARDRSEGGVSIDVLSMREAGVNGGSAAFAGLTVGCGVVAASGAGGAGKSSRATGPTASAAAGASVGGTGSRLTLLTNAQNCRKSSGRPGMRDGELNGDAAALRQSPVAGADAAAPTPGATVGFIIMAVLVWRWLVACQPAGVCA